MPHAEPMHVATPFLGTGQGVHSVPHDETDVSSAHVLPQAWYPALHATPHVLAVHVATPPVGVVQSLLQLPQ